MPSSKLLHTESGHPYIPLTTASPTPIFLTPFFPHDVPVLQQTHSIPAINLRLIAVPLPYTLSDAEWWVDLQMSGKSNLPLQALRSGDPEKGTFIGSASLMPPDSEALQDVRDTLPEGLKREVEGEGEEEFELGYYLRPEWQGKGIMGAAVTALIDWGEKEMGVKRVVLRILEDNEKSRGIVGRVGSLFKRHEEEDKWIDWPEIKGGGRKKLLVWRWSAEGVEV